MKRIILSLLLAVIAVTAFSQSGDITVEVESVAVTGHTTIEYNFTGIETRTYDLTVEVNFDDGVGYQPIPEAHLSGDWPSVSSTETVFSGTIMWNGAASFPNLFHDQTRIKITATPYVFQCGDDVTFTYGDSEVTYGTISKTYNEGESDEYTLCWMDRNLGASEVATSSTDADAYGDLFQWGRFAEGHQVRTNTDHYSGPVSTSVPNAGNAWDGKFITTGSPPYEWLSTQDDNLWQGVNGVNNPCPPGWRVPTDDELDAERLNWGSKNSAGAYASTLKWPVGGYRGGGGALFDVGIGGFVWSSSVSGLYAKVLDFYSGSASMPDYGRAAGVSVRCLKD